MTRVFFSSGPRRFKYSIIGPPLSMPLVARITHGGPVDYIRPLTRISSTWTKPLGRKWIDTSVEDQFAEALFQVFGIGSVGSQLPSKIHTVQIKQGAPYLRPSFGMASSRTIITSWLLPTANAGITTFRLYLWSPLPLEEVDLSLFPGGLMLLAPPYVASVTSVSRRGKLLTAGSNSLVFRT